MGRLPQLDALRGIAVLAMLCWHSVDGWLDPSLKQGEEWNALRTFGGLAAPLFVFLAGAGAALASPNHASRAHTLQRIGRGLEVMVLGYLLRVQTWLLDAGALHKYWTLRAWIPLLAGYLLLWWNVRQLGKPPGRYSRVSGLLGGALLAAIGLAQVDAVAPGRFSRLLQIDVLQAIGVSVALVSGLLAWVPLARRPNVLVSLGLAVALATHAVWGILPGALPVGLAGLFGKFPPAEGALLPSRFPLFPWFAYALIGAGWVRWLRAGASNLEGRFLWSAVLGATLALATSETLPHVYTSLASHPWLTQPARVLFRVGIIGSLSLFAAVCAGPWRTQMAWLHSLGRASLRIYWVHLPFAYGVLANSWKGRLDFPQWAGAFGLLLAAMWLLSLADIPNLGGILRARMRRRGPVGPCRDS